MYSNHDSLVALWGRKDIEHLLSDSDQVEQNDRLKKAATTARAYIDAKLQAAGYALPLTFTPYSATVPVTPVTNPLNALIQHTSDCFTAYYLSMANNRGTDMFAKCYTEGVSWLNSLVQGSDSLPLAKTADPSGLSEMVVYARPSLLNPPRKACCGYFTYSR